MVDTHSAFAFLVRVSEIGPEVQDPVSLFLDPFTTVLARARFVELGQRALDGSVLL